MPMIVIYFFWLDFQMSSCDIPERIQSSAHLLSCPLVLSSPPNPAAERWGRLHLFNVYVCFLSGANLQGDHFGQRLLFVDFILEVPQSCSTALQYQPNLLLPKQNRADSRTTKSWSTNHSCRPPWSPCRKTTRRRWKINASHEEWLSDFLRNLSFLEYISIIYVRLRFFL